MHRSREALRFPFLWHGSGSFDLCHKTTVKVGLPAILSSRGLPCPSIAVFCRKTTDERLGSKGLKPTRRFSLQALRNDPKTIHIEDFPANRSIGGDAMAKFAARRCEHAGGRAWGTRRKGRRRAKAGRTHGGTATEGERVQSRTDELRPSLARAGGMGYNERHGHRTRHPTAGGRGLFRLAFGRARTSRPRTARPRTARFRTAGACAVREVLSALHVPLRARPRVRHGARGRRPGVPAVPQLLHEGLLLEPSRGHPGLARLDRASVRGAVRGAHGLPVLHHQLGPHHGGAHGGRHAPRPVRPVPAPAASATTTATTPAR